MNVESVPTQPDNPLSEREREVAQVLAIGATNAEITRQLHISPHTVKVHIRNIFEKLEVNSRTEASMVLIQHRWVSLPAMPDVEPVAQRRPDPAPLADLNAEPQTWQLIYLVSTVALLIGLLWLPQWLFRPRQRADLLSNTMMASLGQPDTKIEPRWQAGTPLSQPRSRMAVVREGEWIYTIGGESEAGTLATVEAFNLEFNVWESLSSLPEPRANMAAATANGTIFAAGGSELASNGSIISNELWRYNIEADQWAPAGWLPAPLGGLGTGLHR